MKLYFMLDGCSIGRLRQVPTPLLLEVFDMLTRRGFQVESGIAEDMVLRPDCLTVEYDLYILKAHTELSLSLAGILQAQGGRWLNPYLSCVATQNKIIGSQRLRAAGIPTPRSWVTGDLTLLRAIAEETPLIIKPYIGCHGAGVHRVQHPDDLADIPVLESPLLVQEYVQGSGEDLRVYVVGEDVFGVRKPFSRTSFTQPGRLCPLSPEIDAMARRCGEVCGLGLYGLDIIEGPGGPVVVDVNHFPGYRGVPNAAALVADYIERYARGWSCLSLPELAAPATLDG